MLNHYRNSYNIYNTYNKQFIYYIIFNGRNVFHKSLKGRYRVETPDEELVEMFT